jgi:hypothetical protein
MKSKEEPEEMNQASPESMDVPVDGVSSRKEEYAAEMEEPTGETSV